MKISLGAKAFAYPTPVFVIGSYDEKGKANAMVAAWGGICSSDPVCITVSVREARQTYKNICLKKAFTVSIPNEDNLKEADYFGIYSGKNTDKFAETGLTPIKSDLVDAPYIKEFPLIIECKLIKTVELGVHTQFIGEVVDIKCDREVTGDNGLPEIEKVRPVTYDPVLKRYYGIGRYLGKAFSIGKKD
ncbi:MAG: flavin reductase family protein [Dethiobacteria bacterium]|jgi:flavin reductase (DIM6/NTAB) family NADH-FMN oxidoreductase RutF|nr:flavin reductase family protein [Bacillota bacterium]